MVFLLPFPFKCLIGQKDMLFLKLIYYKPKSIKMKKVLLALTIVAGMTVTSCGPSETDKKAAAMLCECLEGFDKEDPSAMLGAAGCMMKMAEDEEMAKASEKGTISAMEESCPEGAEVFKELTKK
jgi:hypothetical protein